MSKILQAGEIGFGILIEHDAGYINTDLNPQFITEGFELKPNEPVLINCILQKWGVKNKNGRIYSKDVLVPQVNEYQIMVDNNSAVSEADHPDCVNASESMICTKKGWKWFTDISEDEEILTLNEVTNKIEIQKIDKKIYLDYKGKMYKFSGKNIDLTVTGNHRFLLENSKTKKREYYQAKDIFENKNNILSSGKYLLLNKGDWDGEYKDFSTLMGVDRNNLSFNIRHDLSDKYTQSINIKSEDWFAFIGIYLAEGHCGGTKSNQYKLRGYDVVLTQKNEEKKKLIESLLLRMPFEYYKIEHIDGKCQYHIHDARLYEYLYKLGDSYNKYIPFELKQASKDLLKIFFKWFQMGDGRCVVSKKTNKVIKESVFTISKRLIEDLQEVLIKIGGSGNITTYQPKDRNIIDTKITKRELVNSDGSIEYNDEIISTNRLIKSENSHLQYNLNISRRKYFWLNNTIKIEKIDFDGDIACVRVKNSNFLLKVNGKSHWTGNSSIISLQNISHMITKMWWGKGAQENVLFGQIKIIVSPGYIKYGVVSVVGDKIVLYLQNKIRLGISSRGVGTLKEIQGENMVQNDFELIGFDLVATPSTPGAYLFPSKSGEISFGENYKNKNGIYLKEEDNKILTAIDKFLL